MLWTKGPFLYYREFNRAHYAIVCCKLFWKSLYIYYELQLQNTGSSYDETNLIKDTATIIQI